MKAEVGKVNKAIMRIRTHIMTELNSLLYAAAYVTTERMAMLKDRKGKEKNQKELIKPWRKDLSETGEARRRYMTLKQRERERLNRYRLEERGTIGGITAWAVGVVLYNAGIVDCTVEELVSMDRETKKILAMNGCLHTRSNVARLYLPRKEGGRRLIGVEECLKEECKSLHSYLRNSTE